MRSYHAQIVKFEIASNLKKGIQQETEETCEDEETKVFLLVY